MNKNHVVSLLNQQVRCVVELMDKGNLKDDVTTLFSAKPTSFTEAEAFFTRLEKANNYYKKMLAHSHANLSELEQLVFKAWLREVTVALDRLIELKSDAMATIYSAKPEKLN